MPAVGARRTGQPAWRKASFIAGGECVEVAQQNGMITIRNSKNPRGRVLRYTPREWRAFTRGVKAGKFDSLGGPQKAKKSSVPRAQSVRDDAPPENLLDLIDRVIYRATATWASFLKHLILLAALFGGLAWVAHAAAGVSPWVAAAGTLGGGFAAGGAAYARGRAAKPTKSGEAQLASDELTRATAEDYSPHN